MKLTEAAFGRFKRIAEREGIDLSLDDARECAEDLLALGGIVYRKRIIERGREPSS